MTRLPAGSGMPPIAVSLRVSRKCPLKGDSSRADFVLDTCRRENVPCLNMFGRLSRECYFGMDAHLNARGHQLLEEEIYNFLDLMMKGSEHDQETAAEP